MWNKEEVKVFLDNIVGDLIELEEQLDIREFIEGIFNKIDCPAYRGLNKDGTQWDYETARDEWLDKAFSNE
jgi:hypothetical protein